VFAGAVISMLVMATASSVVVAQEQSAKEGTPAAAAGPAIDVAATAAAEIEWQEKISSIGVAEAVQGVDVSGSESGVVAEILFDSGSEVKVGEPLVRLDSSKE
jgi:multidrug efflux pump subunit AcrA (membrane-fusion protein)